MEYEKDSDTLYYNVAKFDFAVKYDAGNLGVIKISCIQLLLSE